MIKGYAQYRVDWDGYEIGLIDRDAKRRVTFEFKEHPYAPNTFGETTRVDHRDMDILNALAEALAQLGIMSGDATTAEMKATKYHLEDMRKLALK